MERFFAKDIIEAAKSDKYFDRTNAKEISIYYNIALPLVLKEIVFVRKNLKRIDSE